MTDMTAFVQLPANLAAAPVYTQCTATDFFTAQPNAKYMLHYKNGATPTATGAFTATDPTTVAPPGSSPAAGFADVVVKASGSMLATTELVSVLPNSTRLRDTNGRINLAHGGTLTTLSVAIIGPL